MMHNNIALPFLSLSDATITCGPWSIRLPDGTETTCERLREYLPVWDYAKDLEVYRLVIVRADRLFEELQIASGDRVRIAVLGRWGTGGGIKPQMVASIENHTAELQMNSPELRVDLRKHLPGKQLSQRLFLETHVLLHSPPSGGGILTPSLRCSRLWRDSMVVILEGNVSRFPVQETSFCQLFPSTSQERHAHWHLEFSPSALDVDFTDAVRLHLNSDATDFMRRVVEADPLIVQAVMRDVVSQMVEAVLRDDSADELMAQCRQGSVGAVIQAWLRDAGWDDAKEARKDLEENPTRFRTRIGGLQTKRLR